MVPWIQVYSNILTHDKTYSLAEALKIPNYSAVGLMVSLWCWAAVNAPDGDISNYPPRAISEATGWSKKHDAFYNTLLEIKLIEKTENGKVQIRNWENYAVLLMDMMDDQKKKTAKRVQKYRDKKKQQNEVEPVTPCNVTVTPCNATTEHNITEPNQYYYVDVDSLSAQARDGDMKTGDVQRIVREYLQERNMNLGDFLGITEAAEAKVREIAKEIFGRMSLRSPTEHDITSVFLVIYETSQAENGAWLMTFPPEKVKLLLYAFEKAADAGCPGNWNYINGCLGRLQERGIRSLADAEDYDNSRIYGESL